MGLCSRLELLWAEVCSMLVGLTGGFVLIGLQRATGLHGQLLVEVRRIPRDSGKHLLHRCLSDTIRESCAFLSQAAFSFPEP